MEYGCKQYPGFFTLHSLGFMREDKPDGKRRMQQTWQHILEGLCSVLKLDRKVRPDAFTEQFTTEKFADVLATKNKGQIMKAVMGELKGKADGKVINQVVAELTK